MGAMKIEELSEYRLEQIVRSDQSWVIDHLKTTTIFDTESLDQMLELAKEFASKELRRRKHMSDLAEMCEQAMRFGKE
jgi:hypothetical protein